MENEQPTSAGAMLAQLRWAKTGKAERMRVARMLVAAREAKRAAKGTVEAKSKTRRAAK